MQSLEYEPDTGLLVIYHVGETKEDGVGSNIGAISEALKQHDPRGVLIVMDHASWDISLASWEKMTNMTLDTIGQRPIAVLSPIPLPTAQRELTLVLAEAQNHAVNFYDNEIVARAWLNDRSTSVSSKSSYG